VSETLKEYETFAAASNDILDREVFDGTTSTTAASKKAKMQQLAHETNALLQHLTATESTQAKTLAATLDRLQHIPPVETQLLGHTQIQLSPRGVQRVKELQQGTGDNPHDLGAEETVKSPNHVLKDLVESARKEKGQATDSLQHLCQRTLNEVARLQAQVKENEVELTNQARERATLEGQIQELRGQAERCVSKLAEHRCVQCSTRRDVAAVTRVVVVAVVVVVVVGSCGAELTGGWQ